MSAESDQLNRKIGARIRFVLAAIGCHFGTMGMLAAFPGVEQGPAWTAVQFLITTIGVAIVGDTVRPSGMKNAVFGLLATPGKSTSAAPTPPPAP